MGKGTQGVQTAALAIGGYTTTGSALNESYNGSSWTELGDLNTASSSRSTMGTNSASIAAGGFTGPTFPYAYSMCFAVEF